MTEPVVRVEGEFQLTDTSYGLFSRPAFQRHLASELAAGIGQGLVQQFQLP